MHIVQGSSIGELHVTIAAHNRGGSPVQVTGWGFDTPTGHTLVNVTPVEGSASMPHVLANGSQASWHMPWAGLEENCKELGVAVESLRARVSLGTGVAVYAARYGVGRPPRD